jgi:hypothetical protein
MWDILRVVVSGRCLMISCQQGNTTNEARGSRINTICPSRSTKVRGMRREMASGLLEARYTTCLGGCGARSFPQSPPHGGPPVLSSTLRTPSWRRLPTRLRFLASEAVDQLVRKSGICAGVPKLYQGGPYTIRHIRCKAQGIMLDRITLSRPTGCSKRAERTHSEARGWRYEAEAENRQLRVYQTNVQRRGG